jgi:SAM-dependent methyltransferase
MFAPFAEDLLDAIGVEPGTSVLDIACGTGAMTRAVARRVGDRGRVTGIDLAPGMLAIARDRVPDEAAAPIQYMQGEADQLPIGAETFDLVSVSKACSSSLTATERVERRALRLRPADERRSRPGARPIRRARGPRSWKLSAYTSAMKPERGCTPHSASGTRTSFARSSRRGVQPRASLATHARRSLPSAEMITVTATLCGRGLTPNCPSQSRP